MAASVFYSGFLGTGSIGTNEFSTTKWSVNPTAKLVPFRNSKSGGYTIYQSTFKDADVTIETDYDFGNDIFAAPYGIFPGVTLTNVNLYLHQTASGQLNGPVWNFTNIVVSASPQSLDVDGKIVTRIVGKGSGSYTAP
jgi:hypothetical protein